MILTIIIALFIVTLVISGSCSSDTDSDTEPAKTSFEFTNADTSTTTVQSSTSTTKPEFTCQNCPVLSDSTGTSGLPSDKQFNSIAVIDYNNDKNLDVMLGGTKLYQGDGTGKFTDVTATAFPGGAPNAHGSVWADIDNDGDLDFYAFIRVDSQNKDWTVNVSAQKDTLWINNGGTFTKAADSNFPDLTPLAGKPAYPTSGAGWADFDGDGLVDLAVANNWTTVTSTPTSTENAEVGNVDFLFRNKGGAQFEDKTALTLLSWWKGTYPIKGTSSYPSMEMQQEALNDPLRKAYGLNWADIDNDGDQDLYVSNYRLAANQLFVNAGGTFTEEAKTRKCAGGGTFYSGGVYYGHTIGSAWGDYNNDGFLDLVTCNLSHPGNYQTFSDNTQLYKNDGGTFTEVHESMGIEWRIGHATPCWGDINNDGLLDMYLAVIYYDGIGTPHHYSDLYVNTGTDFGLGNKSLSLPNRNDWTGILADVNNDGLLDLIAGGYDKSNLSIYLNNGGSTVANNNWVKILLHGNGTSTNKSAIGSRITINTSGGKKIVREVNGGFGGGNQAPFIQHIGLGSITGTVDVQINWANGGSQNLTGLEVNKLHEITQ